MSAGRVDISGAERKLRIAQLMPKRVAANVVRDAAAFITQQMVDVILNGEAGTDYPKDYPASVQPGLGGYVGVITSNLRRSIGQEKLGDFLYMVRQIDAQIAPYHDDMVEWTEEKYGQNFYEIAVSLYGEEVANRIRKAILQAIAKVSAGGLPEYRNPF